VDLSGMFGEAMTEHIGQPVVGPVDPSTLLSPITACATHRVDFGKDSVDSLRDFTIPFSFTINRNDTLHGLACWFDVSFMCPNSTTRVTLSTSPTSPITHWYQCRLVFQNPLLVRRGQVLAGSCLFIANENSSYDITVKAQLKGTGSELTNKFFLHNVLFRCYWASTLPSTTSTSSPSLYDIGSSTPSSSTTSYLPTSGAFPSSSPTTWISGGGTHQWTQSPSGWMGPSTAPLSPRRKIPRLSKQSGSGGMVSYGSGADFSPTLDLRSTHSRPSLIPSRTPHSVYDHYTYEPTAYTTDPRYYGYDYRAYGSGNGTL